MRKTDPNPITDLHHVVLIDGLKLERDGKPIVYKSVRLRETNVADERAAQAAAERVMFVNGQPQLMVSDAEFRYAMTARHIAAFECGDLTIPYPMVDVDMLGKLSSHDLSLIEQRVFLVELAAQVRYGAISQADFDKMVKGEQEADDAPQPAGQDEAVGQTPTGNQPVPTLLTDHTRDHTHGTTASNGA